jgi:riboflavin kinase/FMN adenylyltransferase
MSLIVIGNFDGVHRGHQSVLRSVSEIAATRGLKPKLFTFEPHPAVTLGRTAPPLLTTLARKRELVTRACPGIEVVVREFTRSFSEQSPEAFVRDVLVGELGARAVMVGSNFRFGKDRAGGVEELRQFGESYGFDAITEPLVMDDHGVWSSTRIRERIAAGEMTEAAEMLGRPHMISGEVVRGDQRGRTIGFPTCNIPEPPEALPPNGVYATVVDRVGEGGAEALGKGVANLGLRPTVVDDQPGPLLEVHLFDLDEDLYGSELRVHVIERLRNEKKFDGLDALKAQIVADAAQARSRLEDLEPEPSLGAWF